MIAFPFVVGKAFLSPSHPITIRKAYYAELEAEGLALGGVFITTPRGHMRGTIYFGSAGWGPYYQIRARGGSRSVTDGGFTVGQRIIVAIERTGIGVLVTLNESR